MTIEDLVGAELLECRFGKAWARLVFVKTTENADVIYEIDTNCFICDAAGAPNVEDPYIDFSSVVHSVLESRVEEIDLNQNSVLMLFSSGNVLMIVKGGDPGEELLKFSNQKTGEWFVI